MPTNIFLSYSLTLYMHEKIFCFLEISSSFTIISIEFIWKMLIDNSGII